MAYRIAFTPAARKQFEKLPAVARRRVAEAVDRLGENPRPAGVVKLAGDGSIYRVRSGDYRIVYHIEDDKLFVLVIKIGHRREVYR